MKENATMKTLSVSVWAALLLSTINAAGSSPDRDPGPLVRALWLFHRYGSADAVDPRNDLHVKAVLSKALGKENVLSFSGVQQLMDAQTFNRFAGPDGRLDNEELRRVLEANEPATRKRLLPKVAAHADLLSTSFDKIDEPHRAASEKLVDWIVENYRPTKPLEVICICTGNSRRSILGSTMGNIAADYYGLPEVRFHSGGTQPSAFNSRTVKALNEIGVEIEPIGEEAPRGEPATANPKYRLRWGQPGESSEPKMESIEFSKKYSDPCNPQKDFAALMVCSEADACCPFVKGASLRLSMPYLDPKIYDGSTFEADKYSERRDDMGRLMFSIMMQARYRLSTAKKLP